MSCYNCVTKFSIFTKEHSCPNCGFSFCSKCLKQKVTVGEEEKNVCQNCYKKLSTETESKSLSDFVTPGLLLKRLETLENPAKPPITIFRQSAKLVNLKYGLSSEDRKILERLEKLKAEHSGPVLPDENEIKRRLALLRNKSVESMSKPQKLDTSPRTEQEEVEELLKQYIDETGIQINLETSDSQKTEEIEERLSKLKVTGPTAESINISLQDLQEADSETLRIIKGAIAEGQLQRKLKESCTEKEDDSDISDIEEDSPDSELPWCIICNENATLKCFGCDGSLYCNSCFKQGHDYFEMEDHKFIEIERRDSLSES